MSEYKFLPTLTALFITLSMLTIILLYKIVSLHGILISAATLIIPFWYAVSDLIAEIYGYKVAKRLIWVNMFCNFIFIFTIYVFIHLPSDQSILANSKEYLRLYGSLPRIFFSSVIATLLGVFINIYLLSKWKVLVRGKYFWTRSVGSSAIGELIFTVIAFLLEFIGKAPLNTVWHLIFTSYTIKILFAPFASMLCAIFVVYLKQKENGINKENSFVLNNFTVRSITTNAARN